MSIVVRFSPTNLTAELYDSTTSKLEEAGIEFPPEGMDYHVCFGSAGDAARQRDLGLARAVRGVRRAPDARAGRCRHRVLRRAGDPRGSRHREALGGPDRLARDRADLGEVVAGVERLLVARLARPDRGDRGEHGAGRRDAEHGSCARCAGFRGRPCRWRRSRRRRTPPRRRATAARSRRCGRPPAARRAPSVRSRAPTARESSCGPGNFACLPIHAWSMIFGLAMKMAPMRNRPSEMTAASMRMARRSTRSIPSSPWTLEEAIRTRRTHKVYGAEPVDRATLDELFELARWAPNHHLTSPWRFRVLGPGGARAAEGVRGARGGRQARPRADARRRERGADGRPASRTRRTCCSAACAIYIVLLGAHARGLANYWRTPAVLRTAGGVRRRRPGR